ncbi:MAG TPA: VPDSG-CTERM sorting domain-containing protein [Verrucomicrobiae bacterium]|nr:VPDSG-CTERM sorting domain-containing protein [Verrucomicrobiae bacterium]
MLDTEGGLTIGLAAHQRLVGPNLVNDGNGTYFANPGESAPGVSTWNFAWYINNPIGIAGGPGLAAYNFRLTAGSDALGYGTFNPLLFPDNAPLLSVTTAGNSQNLGFGWVTLIGLGAFDPNADDTYAFTLEAFSLTDTLFTSPVASATINVQVGSGASSVPDAGSTSMLLSIALAGFAAVRRFVA